MIDVRDTQFLEKAMMAAVMAARKKLDATNTASRPFAASNADERAHPRTDGGSFAQGSRGRSLPVSTLDFLDT